MTLQKIISGGQTGADQGGLLAAFEAGVETGGTAPSEFYTDFGPNPLLAVFGLEAHGTYQSRTIRNIKNSDGTVLLTRTPQSPGSILTRNECKRAVQPFLEIDTTAAIIAYEMGDVLCFQILTSKLANDIADFIERNRISVLNVAGNREQNRKMFSTTKVVQVIVGSAIARLDASGLVQR